MHKTYNAVGQDPRHHAIKFTRVIIKSQIAYIPLFGLSIDAHTHARTQCTFDCNIHVAICITSSLFYRKITKDAQTHSSVVNIFQMENMSMWILCVFSVFAMEFPLLEKTIGQCHLSRIIKIIFYVKIVQFDRQLVICAHCAAIKINAFTNIF